MIFKYPDIVGNVNDGECNQSIVIVVNQIPKHNQNSRDISFVDEIMRSTRNTLSDMSVAMDRPIS